MKKLWKIYGDEPKSSDNPESILNKYAKQVYEDTDKKFLGLVTETMRENTGEVSYSLYIVAPKLKDYMYRLFEVKILNITNPFPLDLTFYAKDPVNHRTFSCSTPKELKEKLEELIASPVTGGILMHLKNLIELKQSFIKDKLRMNDTPTITLNDGTKMAVGTMRIEGEFLVCYTGKGLREIWRPTMTDEEKLSAKDLKEKSDDYLLQNEYIIKIPIDRIIDINR